MAKRKQAVDKVRASRDGHEYHEIWTARKAMQLLWPDIKLVAIAVEGLSPHDQKRALAETVDIADITLYYGQPTFELATRVTIAQSKYSVADKNTDFRMSHAKKTIVKFAKTYCDYKSRYGIHAVEKKLHFEIITNRPIYREFLQAIDAISKRQPLSGEIALQAKQFKAASDLDGEEIKAFASKCKIIGSSGSLPVMKAELADLSVQRKERTRWSP